MSEAGMPVALASRQRRGIMDAAVQGLGSSRGPHLSIRGGRFRLVSAAGVQTPVDTHYLDVVFVDANAAPSRVFFDPSKPYEQNSDDPPICFSDNGTGPSTQAMSPQAPTCAVCPNNMRGGKETHRGTPTTLCDNRKKMAFILPDDPAVTVYEFQIPPGSLKGLRAYGDWLGQQASGQPGRALDVVDMITRISFDPEREFVLQFQAVQWADDDRTLQLVQYIYDNNLSDVAVGRNDVAHDPANVTKMLAARANGQAQQIAPPAQQAAPQPQGFSLPPRGAMDNRQASQDAPGLNGPAQEVLPPQQEAPKPRGRPKAAPPAPQSNVAPFAPQARTAQENPPIAKGGDSGIPDFLQRKPQENSPPPPTQRFGVGPGSAPPPGVADALSKAMSLPTRR